MGKEWVHQLCTLERVWGSPRERPWATLWALVWVFPQRMSGKEWVLPREKKMGSLLASKLVSQRRT